MRLSMFSILFTIRNMDKPVCKDCKFFNYDSIYNDYQFGRCNKFANKNLISGKIVYEDVNKARMLYCGENGTYFEDKNIDIKYGLQGK